MGLGHEATAALRLAHEAFSRGDIDDGVVHLSAAVRGFTSAGDDRAAAMTCARIGDVLQNRLGRQGRRSTVVRAAIRLVETDEPCVEQGWVAIAPMGCDVDDPSVLVGAGGAGVGPSPPLR